MPGAASLAAAVAELQASLASAEAACAESAEARSDLLDQLHPEIIAMARTVCLARVPTGWTLKVYRGSHLSLTSGRAHLTVSPAIAAAQRGMWRASLTGCSDEGTLHATAQQAIDAAIARHQALTIGDYQLAAAA